MIEIYQEPIICDSENEFYLKLLKIWLFLYNLFYTVIKGKWIRKDGRGGKHEVGYVDIFIKNSLSESWSLVPATTEFTKLNQLNI